MSGKIPTLKKKALAHEEDSSEDDEDFGNDLGISLERLNLGPRKKLVVMGLGGVLVHRMYRFDHKTNFQKHRFAVAIAGNFLGPNSELRIFLDGLVDAEDVPSYVKDYQIGQPPITESHSDWEFYSKIVRRFC
ncbi:hypothetical protein Acr_02g0009440 [Actinidia rufa]|uniref:Uncharacterized protein n=1 Tax=Actinidia rufa TaxID=165716 RepID=A0A7J0E897_9ERIC|nr:hypothetical protein Acr_02g0009440 [Actinidia rufa]